MHMTITFSALNSFPRLKPKSLLNSYNYSCMHSKIMFSAEKQKVASPQNEFERTALRHYLDLGDWK